MRILFLDTETTGLDPNVDKVIELGAVLYDTDLKKPLLIYSDLISRYGLEPCTVVSPEITKITGITQDELNCYGLTFENLSHWLRLFGRTGYIAAHNAEFDRAFLSALLDKITRYWSEAIGHAHSSWESVKEIVQDKDNWICTIKDIPYPDHVQSKKLGYVSADLGLSPNPFAHRAIFDVLQMIKVFEQFDLDDIFAYKNMPDATIRAYPLPPWEDKKEVKDNDIVKSLGFRYQPDLKCWELTTKVSEVETIKEKLGNIRNHVYGDS